MPPKGVDVPAVKPTPAWEVHVPQLPHYIRGTLAASLFATFSASARAADAPCSSSDQTLSCRLQGLLSLLSIAAVVLGTLLALALLAAVWYYRRNRNKDLLPR